MKITDEQKEIAINLGFFDYPVGKIANILGEDEAVIEKALGDKNTELSKLMKIGKDRADYVIDAKLFELAQKGDIKALEKLEHRKKMRR